MTGSYGIFSPLMAFQALSFFGSLIYSALIGGIFFLSAWLINSDRSRQKRDETLITAGIYAVVLWMLSMLSPFEGLYSITEFGGIVWICYHLLDMSFLRSLGVLCAVILIQMVLVFLLTNILLLSIPLLR